MSVLSELITAISRSGIECLEGTIDSVLMEKPRQTAFAAISEVAANYEHENDRPDLATITYKLLVEVYVSEASSALCWSKARAMRDSIISVIEGRKWDSRDVIVYSNKSDHPFRSYPTSRSTVIRPVVPA